MSPLEVALVSPFVLAVCLTMMIKALNRWL